MVLVSMVAHFAAHADWIGERNLRTNSSYSQWVNNEVTRAKNIVDNVWQYEKDEMPVTAEIEIK